jgi:hypothetical protein
VAERSGIGLLVFAVPLGIARLGVGCAFTLNNYYKMWIPHKARNSIFMPIDIPTNSPGLVCAGLARIERASFHPENTSRKRLDRVGFPLLRLPSPGAFAG